MKMFLLLLNIVQFSIILLLTNPDELAHRQVLVERVNHQLSTEAPILDKISNAAGSLSDLGAEYHDYKVFSTTQRNGDTLTFGVLGNVTWMGGAE